MHACASTFFAGPALILCGSRPKPVIVPTCCVLPCNKLRVESTFQRHSLFQSISAIHSFTLERTRTTSLQLSPGRHLRSHLQAQEGRRFGPVLSCQRLWAYIALLVAPVGDRMALQHNNLPYESHQQCCYSIIHITLRLHCMLYAQPDTKYAQKTPKQCYLNTI